MLLTAQCSEIKAGPILLFSPFLRLSSTSSGSIFYCKPSDNRLVMPSTTTARLKHYSIAFKLAVVETTLRTSLREAGRKHGVNEILVRSWSGKQRELSQQQSLGTVRGLDKSHVTDAGKKVLNADVEQQLFCWVVQEWHQFRRVPRETIIGVASELFRDTQLAT